MPFVLFYILLSQLSHVMQFTSMLQLNHTQLTLKMQNIIAVQLESTLSKSHQKLADILLFPLWYVRLY